MMKIKRKTILEIKAGKNKKWAIQRKRKVEKHIRERERKNQKKAAE